TGGIWHCCQMDLRLEPTVRAEAILRIPGEARPALARAFAGAGMRVIRWMQEAGIRFIKGPYDYQAFMLSPPTITPQGRQWEGRGGDVMLRTFEAALARLGGAVLRGHKATALVREAGRITGIEGEHAGGMFQVRAGAVVLADGGFQANPEVIRGPITPVPERVFQRNGRTGMGDALRMAIAVGAAQTDMRGFYGHVLSVDAYTNDRLWPYAWLDFVVAAGIAVGRDGQRFDDEGLGGVHMANAIAARTDPADVLVVADELVWQERGTFNILPPNPRLVEAGGTMHRADTLAALAEKAGIAAEPFLATVERYNAAVKAGAGAQLAPPRSAHKFQAYAIEKPPFYAFPAVAGITYTMGGIAIDACCRVLDASGTPIPALYAVGCCTGGLEGGGKWGYVGGLVKSSVTGLRAGDHILGQLQAAS
ncbi:MAG: FAD-binding protein, partial [Gammaproteobacteria bacterium]